MLRFEILHESPVCEIVPDPQRAKSLAIELASIATHAKSAGMGELDVKARDRIARLEKAVNIGGLDLVVAQENADLFISRAWREIGRAASNNGRVKGGVNNGKNWTKDFDYYLVPAREFLDTGAVVKSLSKGEPERVAKGLDIMELSGERVKEIAAFRETHRMSRKTINAMWLPLVERSKLPNLPKRNRDWLSRLKSSL